MAGLMDDPVIQEAIAGGKIIIYSVDNDRLLIPANSEGFSLLRKLVYSRNHPEHQTEHSLGSCNDVLAFTWSNGERIELPPTDAGYDFLREIAIHATRTAVV